MTDRENGWMMSLESGLSTRPVLSGRKTSTNKEDEGPLQHREETHCF